MKALTTLYPVSSLNPALVCALRFHSQPETYEQWVQYLYRQMSDQQWEDFIEEREHYQRDAGARTGRFECEDGDVIDYRLLDVDGVPCVQIVDSPVLERFRSWRNQGYECDAGAPSDHGLWGYALPKFLLQMEH